MFGFLIKKSFFDTWDNLLAIILVNMTSVAILVLIRAIFKAASEAAGIIPHLYPAAIIISIHLILGLATKAIEETTAGGPFVLKSTIVYFTKIWLPCFISGILSVMIFYADIRVIDRAIAVTKIGSYFTAGLLFWINLLWFMTLQFIFVFLSDNDSSFFKATKKSILLVLYNPGDSLKIFLFSTLLSLLSLPTFFFIPGFTGIGIFHRNAYRFIMYKYDWLKTIPSASTIRRNIPWSTLLSEEKERLGHRNLKSLIFPWKD